MINEGKARVEITSYRDHCYNLDCMFSIFFFSQFQRRTKVATCHFSFHCEILPTCNHSNVRSSTVKMAKQSSVILRTEQHSVEVMICTSLTMATLSKTRIVTLATHTNHQLGISLTLHKPSRLLVATSSHQQKLKYFTEYYDILRETRILKLT